MTLEELIARQRFMLNRTTRVARLPENAEKPGADTGKQWAEFENCTAKGTRELAEFLEKITGEQFPMLYAAEKEMLAAADLLPACRYADALPHDKDALTRLIEARNTVRQFLCKPNPNPNAAQQIQDFDRKQVQKLRRPKERDEQQEARQIAERLRELAKQEEFVYATVAKPTDQQAKPSEKAKSGKAPSSSSQESKPEEPKTSEQKEGKQKENGKKDGSPTEQSPSEGPESKKPGSKDSLKGSSAKGSSSKDTSAKGSSENEQPQSGTPDNKPGQESGTPKEEPSSGSDVEELKKRQSEIADEARAIEEALRRLGNRPENQGVSPLALERMDAAAKKAEETAGSLDRGNKKDAAKTAKDAAGMFAELASHVEGLLSREAAQRIAAARNVSDQMARRQRELSDRLGSAPSKRESQTDASKGSVGEGATSEPREGGQNGEGRLADEFSRLTETGRTLQDLLERLSRTGEGQPLRAESVEQIAKLAREADLPRTLERIRQIESALRTGRGAAVRVESREIAERLEILTQRLEALHRAILAPRLESLVALEKRAAALQQQLKTLDSQARIAQWHREADVLVQDLSKEAVESPAAASLLEAMHEQGWGRVVEDYRWVRRGSYYLGPTAYDVQLTTIIAGLQEQVRELVLRELISAQDEATPPEYKELVERYFQILSQRGSSKP